MITSKQIVSLSETYLASKRIYNGELVIYINPTSSDIVELNKSSKSADKSIRFIVDFYNKKLYVWDAYLGIHNEFYDVTHIQHNQYQISGFANIVGNKLKFSLDKIESFDIFLLKLTLNLEPEEFKKFLTTNILWVNNYLLGFSDYLKKTGYL